MPSSSPTGLKHFLATVQLCYRATEERQVRAGLKSLFAIIGKDALFSVFGNAGNILCLTLGQPLTSSGYFALEFKELSEGFHP